MKLSDGSAKVPVEEKLSDGYTKVPEKADKPDTDNSYLLPEQSREEEQVTYDGEKKDTIDSDTFTNTSIDEVADSAQHPANYNMKICVLITSKP